MALVSIGNDTFIDTDDLNQREYHYYRKAESLADEVPTATMMKIGEEASKDD